jgi:hypothetical protein
MDVRRPAKPPEKRKIGGATHPTTSPELAQLPVTAMHGSHPDGPTSDSQADSPVPWTLRRWTYRSKCGSLIPAEDAILEGIVGDRILRCSDDHLFVSNETARLFRSVHLEARRIIRCPVDGEWRVATNVNSADLTEAELQEARSHHT